MGGRGGRDLRRLTGVGVQGRSLGGGLMAPRLSQVEPTTGWKWHTSSTGAENP